MKPEIETFVQAGTLPKLVGYEILPHTKKKFFNSRYVDLLEQDTSGKDNFVFFYEFKARRKRLIQPVSAHYRLLLLFIMEGSVDSFIRDFGEIQFREGFCYLLYMPAEIFQKSYIKKGNTRWFILN